MNSRMQRLLESKKKSLKEEDDNPIRTYFDQKEGKQLARRCAKAVEAYFKKLSKGLDLHDYKNEIVFSVIALDKAVKQFNPGGVGSLWPDLLEIKGLLANDINPDYHLIARKMNNFLKMGPLPGMTTHDPF